MPGRYPRDPEPLVVGVEGEARDPGHLVAETAGARGRHVALQAPVVARAEVDPVGVADGDLPAGAALGGALVGPAGELGRVRAAGPGHGRPGVDVADPAEVAAGPLVDDPAVVVADRAA